MFAAPVTSLRTLKPAVTAPSKIGRGHTTRRGVITASYQPYHPGPGDAPSPLHGVFLSSDLPPVLADYTSVYDARDAVETCTGLDGCDKDACYAIFGLDSGAEKWFDVVYNLEHALELETDPEELATHHGQER